MFSQNESVSHIVQEETHTPLNLVENMDAFITDVNSGNWDVVMKVVGQLDLPSEKLIDLFEQVRTAWLPCALSVHIQNRSRLR